MLGKPKSKAKSPSKTPDVNTEGALQKGYEKMQFQRAAFDPARWSQRHRQKALWRKLERLRQREVEH